VLVNLIHLIIILEISFYGNYKQVRDPKTAIVAISVVYLQMCRAVGPTYQGTERCGNEGPRAKVFLLRNCNRLPTLGRVALNFSPAKIRSHEFLIPRSNPILVNYP
jgi:hypothetical protein